MMTRVIKNPSGYHSHGRTAQDKAAHFGVYAREHGWTGKWSIDEETGILHLFARRDESETIDIWWLVRNAAAHPDMPPIYALAGERIKCRNVSEAAAIAAKSPDENRLKKAVQKQNRQRRVNTKYVVNPGIFKNMPDDEIEKFLLGKTITWTNSISGDYDTADVLGRKTIKVSRNGRDQVHFTDDSGFHAVYLDAIVSVK